MTDFRTRQMRQSERVMRWVTRMRVVPDRAMVTAPVAHEALDRILVAGWSDRRFGDLDTVAASVLASLLGLYADQGPPPSTPEIAAATGLSKHKVDRLLEDLHRHDLVLLEHGCTAIQGAYPFTESVTGHTITFVRTDRTLNTMCVIDALGAGAMCCEDAIIRSACHACAAPIVVNIRDHGMTLAEVNPQAAIVWTGFRQSCGCAADSLCTELVFFCSDAHLGGWRASGAASDGRRLSIEEAFQVGKALFADRVLLGRG